MTALMLLVVLRAGAQDLSGPARQVAAGDLAGAESSLLGMLSGGYADTDVYYDLGNVAWRQGDTGRAILAWRRAAMLAPRDPDVGANLDFARRSVLDAVDPVVPTPALAPWQAGLSPGEAAWCGATLLGLSLLLLGLRGRLPRGALAPALGAGVLGAGLAGGGWAAWFADPAAVVLVDEVTATSDLGGGVTLFTLHEGAEVLAAEVTPTHVLLALPDERRGWVAREHVGLVDPWAPFPDAEREPAP
jgi:hypothetical protein